MRVRHAVIAVRGERLALTRLEVGTADVSPGAPHDELLQLSASTRTGRIALQVWFDIEDIDAAIAELDAAHARFEEAATSGAARERRKSSRRSVQHALHGRRWDAIGAVLTDDIKVEDRRRGLRREGNDRATELAELQAIADLGTTNNDVKRPCDPRGAPRPQPCPLLGPRPAARGIPHRGPPHREIDAEERIVAYVAFDPDDFEAAIAELDARYLAGEAAPYAHTWSVIARAYAAFNRHEIPADAGLGERRPPPGDSVCAW